MGDSDMFIGKAGKSVAVVDQGSIAGGQTSRTTGHLTWVLDDRYSNLEKLFGEKNCCLQRPRKQNSSLKRGLR